jgi:hypothetical protein
MKTSWSVLLATFVVLGSVSISSGQVTSRANRAWKPFFAAFSEAAKKRDKDALNKMMSRDFYYLSSGGDENGNGDTRDEAFDYWENSGVGAWDALEKVLAQGTVVNKNMVTSGRTGPSRVAPPLANDRQAIKDRRFDWYAVFEFRNGRWYLTAFTECCEH